MRLPYRLLCLILCAALSFTVPSGCSSLMQALNAQPADVELNTFAYADAFIDNAGYRHLEDSLRSCYESFYTALTEQFNVDEIITIHSDGHMCERIGIKIHLPCVITSKEEAQQLYDAFFQDNPQFFYVSNEYTLEGYMDETIPQYNQINLIYTMDHQERTAAVEEMESVVNQIFETAPVTDDQYEMELHLHNALAALCNYNESAAAADYALFPYAYTAYGALVEGQAVCEGYSRAMQLLLQNAEIACSLITGRSAYNGERHMWNLVTINGNNYQLDVTWDDSEDQLRYNYFNITTAQAMLSHIPDEGQPGVDACTAHTDNYFRRNGLYIDTYQRNTIATAIAGEIINGRERVQLAFSPETFDNGVLFLKNATLTKQMVNALLNDTGLALWDYSLQGETNEHILFIDKK